MANKSNNNKQSSGISLNKLSFYLLVAAAVLYLVGLILHFVVGGSVVGWLQNIVAAIMICVVAVLAYRYIRSKPTVWLVLYIIVLLVVIVGIIIPLVA